MECADRDRLHDVLRIATHELKWSLEELGRMLPEVKGPVSPSATLWRKASTTIRRA
jgi:hypothetical protein